MLALALIFALSCGDDSTGTQTNQPSTTAEVQSSDSWTPNDLPDDGPPTNRNDVPTTAPDSSIDAETAVSGLGMDYASTAPGVMPRFAPEDSDWLSTGWPSDRWRKADGTLDLSSFPNPGVELLSQYIEYGTTALNGFSLNGSVYLTFDGAIDMSELPSPQDATKATAHVQIVNTTPNSPRYNERLPLRFDWYDSGDDPFYSPKTLALRPVFGFPLAEGDTYCAVVTRAVKDTEGRFLQQPTSFLEALANDKSLSTLKAWLSTSPLTVVDIAVATCFTTQTATAELRTVYTNLSQDESPLVETMEGPHKLGEFYGVYSAPNFQAGDKPYDKGGDLVVDDQGNPIVQSMESIRFLLMHPTRTTQPSEGWPTVLYAHGTGGDYQSCRKVSGSILARGLAVLCIDQPLHGTRGPDPKKVLSDVKLITASFNFTNPRAGRMSFRQSAIDTFTLSHMVKEGRFNSANTQSGVPVLLDPEKIYFFGHSHGGLSGALVMGIDSRISAGILSGAGAGIINTILLRTDPSDLSKLLASVLLIPEDNLNMFHPALTLVQMLIDATDTVNYAPLWRQISNTAEPRHIFITQGTADHASAAITNNTLAAAGRVPIITPIAQTSDAHDLLGMAPEVLPISKNITAETGTATAGMKQWQDGDHWVAFKELQAKAMWRNFLASLPNNDAPTLDVGETTLPNHVQVSAGDQCDTAGTIDTSMAPLIVTGNTSLMTNNYSALGCGEAKGADQRDAVYALTADQSGRYRVTLWTPPKKDPKKDPPTGPNMVYVTSDCSAECQGMLKDGALELELDTNETVYLIVDGTTSEHVGPFRLEVKRTCANLACGEVECGSVGCSQCGQCAKGTICDEGQCVETGAGDSCETAWPIEKTPFMTTGSTLSYSSTYFYENNNCPGFNAAYGATSSDVAYSFTTPKDGLWEFLLVADYDANLYVTTNCDAMETSCLGAHRHSSSRERIVLDLPKDQSVYVIVDGASNDHNDSGAYALTVRQCQPDCGGKTCGDDGCGGTCGTCSDGETCVEESDCHPNKAVCKETAFCETITPGDQCVDPFPIDELPFSHTADSSEFYHDFKIGKGQCPGLKKSWGHNARDTVYALLAPKSALYEIRVKADFDSSLYAVTDCNAVSQTCLKSDQLEKKNGGERMYLSLEADSTTYFIVDGAYKEEHKGEYTLTVKECVPNCKDKACGTDGCGGSCGSCEVPLTCSNKKQCVPRPGDSCGNAINVGTLPWSYNVKKIELYGNDVSGACAGMTETGSDIVYRFKVPETNNYDITLDAAFEGAFSIVKDCTSPQTTCVEQATQKLLALNLQKDDVVNIVVHSTPGAKGKFTLKIMKTCVPECADKSCGDDGCGGVCGQCPPPNDLCTSDGLCTSPEELSGNSCKSAFEIPSEPLPFESQGTTEDAHNHYAFGDTHCLGWVGKGGASNEQIWRFVPNKTATYRIAVRAQEFNAAVYVVTECSDISNSCLAAADGNLEDVLQVQLQADEPVYIVVDGASNTVNEAGTYSISVDAL